MKNYRIGINVNTSKDPSGESLNKVTDIVKNILPQGELVIFKNSLGLSREIADSLDILLVLGGDGTILSTARFIYGSSINLFGINIGHLGFLSSCELKNFEVFFQKWITKEYTINERMLLKCQINGEDSFALNDIIISRGTFSRILRLEIYVDDSYYTSYTADGIIISTPTGSTAYSLSAGGPIIYPELESLCITPICPHANMFRSIVLDGDKKISIKFKEAVQNSYISLDGQKAVLLTDKDQVTITKAEDKVKLVTFKELDYFTILRNKLLNQERM